MNFSFASTSGNFVWYVSRLMATVAPLSREEAAAPRIIVGFVCWGEEGSGEAEGGEFWTGFEITDQ